MRAFLVYNAARLGLFIVALGLLYLIGVGGLMLWALALIISGIASYVVLSRLRDNVSRSVNTRVQRATAKATDIKVPRPRTRTPLLTPPPRNRPPPPSVPNPGSSARRGYPTRLYAVLRVSKQRGAPSRLRAGTRPC
jgi:hypothetical protein